MYAVADTPSASLAEDAFVALEEMLVTLRLPPGAVVQEKALALSLGIGRTPVREAIQRLSHSGLLQVLPRKGLMVAPLLRSDLLQVLEARRVLERLLVIKALERASDDQCRALRELAVEMEHRELSLQQYYQIDQQLDLLLTQACGNVHLARALDPLHIHCRRLWFMQSEHVNIQTARTLHAGLANAVAGGDATGALRALNGIISELDQLVGRLDSFS